MKTSSKVEILVLTVCPNLRPQLFSNSIFCSFPQVTVPCTGRCPHLPSSELSPSQSLSTTPSCRLPNILKNPDHLVITPCNSSLGAGIFVKCHCASFLRANPVSFCSVLSGNSVVLIGTWAGWEKAPARCCATLNPYVFSYHPRCIEYTIGRD